MNGGGRGCMYTHVAEHSVVGYGFEQHTSLQVAHAGNQRCARHLTLRMLCWWP